MAGYPLRLPGTPTLSQRRFLLLVFPLISCGFLYTLPPCVDHSSFP
ncbi:hypothetical protein GQ607_006779 [Colletotrichum asianum]|uniref:Uncharacterized protein n=1 Tax=Colletotrichum asianum TaxID=702518 RepID=A0A8H3ZTP6_9PEZI|nr:hypothetical protein GQ607_006779 [Colletotrichum asianum]